MSLIFALIGWAIFGLIVGALARFLVPGEQKMSMVMTIILGVVGSYVGGGISYLIFGSSDGKINPAGFILSLIGAIVVVLVYIRLQQPKKT